MPVLSRAGQAASLQTAAFSVTSSTIRAVPTTCARNQLNCAGSERGLASVSDRSLTTGVFAAAAAFAILGPRVFDRVQERRGRRSAAMQRRALVAPNANARPEALYATDGQKPGAPPEDVFTWDTVSARMPKIMDSVVKSLPSAFASDEAVMSEIRNLQEEMRTGAPLRLLKDTTPRVGANTWNPVLQPYVDKGRGWHDSPWWVVENYMYKRLLEALSLCEGAGAMATAYDPFEPQKTDAMNSTVAALEGSIGPLLDYVQSASTSASSAETRREALEAAVFRSLWGNKADLSLSAGLVETVGDLHGSLLSDDTAKALQALLEASGNRVLVVLDNHGMEVVCDLVLVDALLSLVGVQEVVLHVKDAPVFVSDVTEGDVPGILDWLSKRSEANGSIQTMAKRLQDFMAAGRLQVRSSSFYTSSIPFWDLLSEASGSEGAALKQEYESAAAVIIKGDANYRRLLNDLHWPYDTDFQTFAEQFWPSKCLIALRTMKSGVALGVSQEQQAEALKARPKDWLTSGVYGQVQVCTTAA
eukprot:TRINITY_DN10647_c0_g1_i1.p1 TRINITY_DN10647_c0_g1~~TRINITY_DN10647_c0_g1_i1.p1  ORF type:complete len:531 (-),score=83.86 TRINITY_DN10647_c0_g1_i1:386-1978(-)